MEMRRKIAAVGICSLGLLAIGSAPRYLEELRIGGGYGDAANGGADFDKSGNIATDGCIQAAGGLESGKDSATRGVVTAWDGSGGNAPGALRLGTANGAIGFVFMSDDRSGLRISGTLPASDADGEWLKAKTVTDLSSPPAIGGTTPNTGRFSSLDSTGAIRGGGRIITGSTSVSPEGRLHVYGGASGFTGSHNYRIADGALVENDGDAVLLLQGPSNSYSEIWFGDSDTETAGRVRYEHSTDTMRLYTAGSDKFNIDQYGNAEHVGDLKVDGGDITAGIAGEMRGTLMACRGSGGNTAGALKLVSVNGTVHYYFAENDGTLKLFNGLPSSDSDGTEVGAQFGSTITAFAANDTTPSVSAGLLFRVPDTWTSGNNVTMLDSGTAGQQVVIIGGDSDCVFVDGTNLKLAGNWTAASGKTLSLVFDGTNWYETARADN